MSYGNFATGNKSGFHRSYSPRVLGAVRSPAQVPARAYQFRTQALAGLGAVVIQDPIEVEGPFYAGGKFTPVATHRIFSPTTRQITQETETSATPTTTPSSSTTPASSTQGAATTPTSVSSQPTTSAMHFPAGATIGQTWQDSLGNVWEYTSQGWQIAARGPTGQQTSLLPSSPTVGQMYTDETGNIWMYTASGWVMTVAANETPSSSTIAAGSATGSVALTSGAAATAQAGTPVPVGYPTNEAFTDSSGNIWTWTATAGWQITSSSAAAPTNWAGSITAWLQESTIWSGVENFWVVGGAGAVGLVLYGMFNRGKR